MKNNFLKKYIDDTPIRFYTKENENENLFKNINRLLNFIGISRIETGSDLLDLGSGDGSFYRYCKKNGIQCEFTDGSVDNIDFEKDKLKFENEKFDFILMNSVIEHLHNPINILNESKRVLKKDGILIVITPNFRYAYKNFYDDPTHVQPYTHISIEKILKITDYTQIKTYPFLINKPLLYWNLPFKFFLASALPFKNHTYKKFPIPRFLRGNSTALICVCSK
jgi:ubiquinone/menaquinone biosynthesis C-methylase UbiE